MDSSTIQRILIAGAGLLGIGLMAGGVAMSTVTVHSMTDENRDLLTSTISKNAATILFGALALLLSSYVYFTAYPSGFTGFILFIMGLSICISLAALEVSAVIKN